MVTTVLEKVDSYLKNHPGPHFAAFDADGTLWANDVGENFFQYQIDHCRIPALKKVGDPWKHYLALKKEHPPTAYLWLAEICNGYPIGHVEQWAIKAAEMYPPKVYAEQKEIIAGLQSRGVKVYVVSASVEWSVVGALKVAGFTNIKALGVKTKVIGRNVSDEPTAHVTWREGKRKAFLADTANKFPMLSCGNTMGDLHLLEMSQGIKIAVQSQADGKHHASLYEDEQNLYKLAKINNWMTFSMYK